MKMEMERLDENVERALEEKPAVLVPEGFAARVAAQAAAAQPMSARLDPRRRSPRVRRMAMTRMAAVVAMAVCAVVLFVAAPRVGNHYASWPFAVEMLALAQMAGIAWGLVALNEATGNRQQGIGSRE